MKKLSDSESILKSQRELLERAIQREKDLEKQAKTSSED
jgi:hypothetical protein